MQQVLPTVTLDRRHDARHHASRRRRRGGARHDAAEGFGEGAAGSGHPRGAVRGRQRGRSHRGTTPRQRARSWRSSREPARIESRRELADIGVTIVKFSNGVEAWLKPTDFKNDQVLFTMYAHGRHIAGVEGRLPAGELRHELHRPVRSRRDQGARPRQDAGGQARVRVAVHFVCDTRHLRLRERRPISKRRCNCSIWTSPHRATTLTRSR